MSDWLIEAARRPRSSDDLPDGLIREDGKVLFRCRSCENWSEWPAEIADFDIDAPENVCGGSPRCCP